MFDVIFHNVKSFGKWVNEHCKADGVAVLPDCCLILVTNQTTHLRHFYHA